MNAKQSVSSAGTRNGAQHSGASVGRIGWGAIALLAVLLIVGFGLMIGLWVSRQPTTVTVSEPQAGGEVRLQPGDVLQINLEGNPSTGYSWIAEGLDTGILAPNGEPEFQPASSALGAGGTVTTRFVAVGVGQTTLTLQYARPFEHDVLPLQTFTVRVVVTTP